MFPHLDTSFARVTAKVLGLPFDMAREQYAKAVKAGFLPSSMLASRDVGRALDACEKVTLGPWARRV
jgi:hypothetical protein